MRAVGTRVKIKNRPDKPLELYNCCYGETAVPEDGTELIIGTLPVDKNGTMTLRVLAPDDTPWSVNYDDLEASIVEVTYTPPDPYALERQKMREEIEAELATLLPLTDPAANPNVDPDQDFRCSVLLEMHDGLSEEEATKKVQRRLDLLNRFRK